MSEQLSLADVQIALDGVSDRQEAMGIVRTVGGVAALSMLPPDRFPAVIRQLNARARRSDALIGRHPTTNASRVNESAQRFWDERKAAKPGEVVQMPSDPGGHNERELSKIGTDRAAMEEFANGIEKDV